MSLEDGAQGWNRTTDPTILVPGSTTEWKDPFLALCRGSKCKDWVASRITLTVPLRSSCAITPYKISKTS